jgi:exodeoxyribonuclease III
MEKKTLSIVSWNVNGIRACAKKGFLEYLQNKEPDIIIIQETKAQIENLEEILISPSGYHSVWHSAEKKGYSGVATFTKIKPNLVLEGIGIEKYDREGRIIVTEFEHFILLNIYFPNGQMNEDRLKYKLDFYEDVFAYCRDLISQGKNVIIGGDYNIAHKAIDLANPKANEKYSGFLPIERKWLDRIIDDGFVDTFRAFNNDPEKYTWWTYRFGARKRNIGWRIDYFFVNEAFMPCIQSASIDKEVMGSDHCPIEITLKI